MYSLKEQTGQISSVVTLITPWVSEYFTIGNRQFHLAIISAMMSIPPLEMV